MVGHHVKMAVLHVRGPHALKGAYDALRAFDRIAASQSDLDSRIMPQTRYQFVAGAFGDEPARIDNPNPRAKTLRFLHVVRGVENRGARVAQALHQIEDRATALRVDADCRLIQDQYLRSMQSSAREIQASFHPTRIGADDVVGARRKTDRIECAFDRIVQRGAVEIVHPAPEVEIFARGEIEVESDRLWNDPDKRACRRTCVDIDAIDGFFARVSSEYSGDHRDRGCLAGAVGSEQTIDFTGCDGESDTIDRDSRSEALAEPSHEQRGLGLLRGHRLHLPFRVQFTANPQPN